MASVAQSSFTSGFSSGGTIALAGVTAGRPLVAIVGLQRYFSTAPTLSVSGGGATWSYYSITTTGREWGLFFCVGTGGTGGSVTVTMTGDWDDAAHAYLIEVADADTTTPYDDHAGQFTGGGTHPYDITSGLTDTLNTDSGLKLFAMEVATSNLEYTLKSGDGDTAFGSNTGQFAAGYQELAATTAVQGRWTVTGQTPGETWPVGVLVIRGAGGGGTTTRRYSLGLTGVG